MGTYDAPNDSPVCSRLVHTGAANLW